MSFGITVKMADLSSVTSRGQSQTCTICRERHLKKQIVVQTQRSGIKFTSYKQYIFGLLFSIKVKDSYRPKYTSSFLICPNINDSQTFKSSRLMVVIHYEIVHELASLRFPKLNLECENIKMGRITYEDLFFHETMF